MTLTLTGAGAASASSAFTPSSIAGLQTWYKADAGTSTTTDGVAISQWNDQSGNARHAAQATGANQPLYKAAILNGRPVVRFDGVNDFLDSPTFALSASYTLFAVAKSAAGAVPQSVLDSDDNGTTPRQFQFRFNTGVLEHVAFNTVPAAFTDSETAVLTNFSYLTGRVDTTTVQTWVNGTSGGSTALTGTGQSGSSVIRIGDHRVPGQPLNGDVAEALYYNTALSTVDRQSVESYLKTKYGL